MVRDASPRVVGSPGTGVGAHRDKPDQLNLTTADGRIVEQALAVRDVLDGELTLAHRAHLRATQP